MVHPTVTEANWTDATGIPKTTSGFIGENNYVKATVPNFCNEEVRIYFHVKAHKDNAYYKNRYFITTKTDSEGKINTAVSFSKEMKAKLGISNWNVNLKFALVGVVDNQLYAFKGISYPVSNAELKVTTKKEILDLYFEYEGKRLVPTDRVPYNSKTPTKIKMVAHTRNMMGEKLKFTAHALEDDSILENLSESTIKANGIAELSFQKKAPAHLKKDDTETYYAGVEGFSTKHFKDKTLVFKVGAKWDTNSIIHSMTWGNKVSKEFREKVVEICMNIWPNHPDLPAMINGLMAVMYRETAGTFATHQIEGKPLKDVSILTKNDFAKFDKKTGEINGSRAVGLIQFTQKALVSLGDFVDNTGYDKLHTMKLKYAKMTQVEQLEKVRKYFHKLSKLPQTPEDIYAAVFAPDSVGKKNSDTIYAIGTKYYKSNKSLDVNINKNGIQKIELINKFYESLEEGNKSGNIAIVTIKEEKSNKWHHPLDRMELRGWYGSGFYPGDSDHGDAEVRISRHHDGLDLYAPVGTQIYACITGEVYDDYYSNTYGNTLGIKGNYKGQTYYFFYGHLSEKSVKKGDKVTEGDKIGKTGQTGNASGQASKMNHLHFEVRNTSARTGGRLNPLTTINELNKDVVTNPDRNKQTGN